MREGKDKFLGLFNLPLPPVVKYATLLKKRVRAES
jgi:hypothetical protein